jgi:DNA-directed RNA polymerase subunit RPC12/RpoP
VRVLSELFRRVFLEKIAAARQAGELQFFTRHAGFADWQNFAAFLAPYAIENGWSTASDHSAVPRRSFTFKWKDYRLEGRERYQVMTLATDEFIRRFLIHVLPAGFYRIRYYGLLARGKRAENVARARELLTLPVLPVDAIKAANTTADEAQTARHACPRCGGRMLIVERFERGSTPHYHRSPPTPVIRIDTS